MDIKTKLILNTINKFSSDENDGRRRFENFMAFLGIEDGDKESNQPIKKEAAGRERNKVKGLLRDWFFEIIEKYVPAGYFSRKNQFQHKWRGEAWDYAGKMLYDKLRYAILQAVAYQSQRTLGAPMAIDEFDLPEDAIDNKIYELLVEMQSDPSFIRDSVNIWLKQSGGKEDPSIEPEVEEAKKSKREEYQQGLAEVWFRPIVTNDVYDSYKKFINERKDTEYKQTAERVKRETGRTELKPEDIGVKRGKPDPTAFKILNDIKNFNLEIHDAEPAYDTREKRDTWKITFSIPELAKKIPSLYGQALYTLKIPPSVRSLNPTDEIPVSVQHSYETKAGKKGMSIRLDDVYEDWTEDTMDTLDNVGFTSKIKFNKFIDAISSNFKDQWRTGKNLNEMLSDLGGGVRFHGKSFSSADDLGDIAAELSGHPSTQKELLDQQDLGKFEDRMKKVKDKIEEAIDVVGEKVNQYLGSIDKDQSETMRDAIVKQGNFPTLSDLAVRLRNGDNLKIGWNNILQTSEIVDKALEFIFHPQVDPGITAWKSILIKFLKDNGLKNRDLKRLVKWILFKNKLEKSGKPEAALKDILSKTDYTKLNSIISDQDALKEWHSALEKKYLKECLQLKNSIKDTVESKLKSHPAFRKFWERRHTWDASIKPYVEANIERIFMGDETVPKGVKIPINLEKQIVHTVELPPTQKDRKPVKKKKIDLSKIEDMESISKGLSNFIGDLADYYTTQRLQQAWTKDRESNNKIIKIALQRNLLN